MQRLLVNPYNGLSASGTNAVSGLPKVATWGLSRGRLNMHSTDRLQSNDSHLFSMSSSNGTGRRLKFNRQFGACSAAMKSTNHLVLHIMRDIRDSILPQSHKPHKPHKPLKLPIHVAPGTAAPLATKPRLATATATAALLAIATAALLAIATAARLAIDEPINACDGEP